MSRVGLGHLDPSRPMNSTPTREKALISTPAIDISYFPPSLRMICAALRILFPVNVSRERREDLSSNRVPLRAQVRHLAIFFACLAVC